MSEIRIAENAGFCFGVERAVREVYSLCEENGNTTICTLGNLIHNPTITSDLSRKGVRTVNEGDIDRLFEEGVGVLSDAEPTQESLRR